MEKNVINTENGKEGQPKLEEVFEELEAIAEKLEDGEVSLEESFALYNQGANLLKVANEIIEGVEKKIQVLDDGGHHEL